MNESKWPTCNEPKQMLDYLRSNASERKSRLFACACCRDIWHLITRGACRHAVEVAERFSDGRATATYLSTANEISYQAAAEVDCRGVLKLIHLGVIAQATSLEFPYDPATYRAAYFAMEAVCETAALEATKAVQCVHLRDIFGNPFRPILWNFQLFTANVWVLARTIYADQAFGRMTQLADALEEAGCDNAAILNHCRSKEQHVRGCWVMDLLLGKE